MALQDLINAIDETKPINATATAKPTFKSMRDNFAAIKAALQSMGGGILLFNTQALGTAPTLIGSFWLSAGVYAAPSALVGCGNPLYAATLELRKPDGTILCTIGGVAGGLAWRTASTGFTLTVATEVDFILYTNAANEPAFIHGFSF